MTVLPETAHHFSVFASAARAVEPTADASALRAHARRFPRRAPDEAPGGGTTHWLFLDAAHMIDVNHVLNLLRDVYHDVVNATRAASGDGGPLSARPRAAGLGTRLLAPCVGAAARAPTASGASWQQAGARGGADGSARGAADDAAPRSAAHAAAPPRGHTRRWRDLPLDSPAAAAARPPVRERLLEPVRPGSSELHACAMGYDELCARFDAALGGARRRQMSIALATLTAGIIVLVACSASYALETSALLAVNPGVSASVIYDMYDGYAIRTHVYLLGGQVREPTGPRARVRPALRPAPPLTLTTHHANARPPRLRLAAPSRRARGGRPQSSACCSRSCRRTRRSSASAWSRSRRSCSAGSSAFLT